MKKLFPKFVLGGITALAAIFCFSIHVESAGSETSLSLKNAEALAGGDIWCADEEDCEAWDTMVCMWCDECGVDYEEDHRMTGTPKKCSS